ncbi:Zeaxanthin glucosyl transferase [Actinokineospora spheciospongiae]|uniref:Zeaxanthin glucosyl transferase n=1 Tax=Actinokineospora spheciospongiae TaxID=909613 RepID=W7IYP7_9PSEU|nr:glycosyltransferase [Actinokineospora spheciospongiae]EWC61606.1 Zeaxanthin glucosyl transferase [Actinokineospora spheciospongiae]PWW54914.1 MGT family glycosyltransferase [Actinokineospora spheciospongiae]
MSRLLLVVPPFTGHVSPLVGVAAELGARGHEVVWAGDPDLLRRMLPDSAVVRPCRSHPDVPRPAASGFAAFKHLWDHVFVPLTEAMAPGVERAIADTAPDLVVADQQAFAGAFAAERAGLPWVTSASTSAELTDPLALVPAVAERVAGQLADLRARFGDPAATTDPRFSPLLLLAFTSPALAGPVGNPGGGAITFAGQVPRPDVPAPDFPWDRLDDRPLVLVSLGTVSADAGDRFLRECAAALAERPGLQAVVVDPGGALADPPPNVLALPHVPQQAVLDRAAATGGAVLCHGGHNTVCEALARGLPLVVAPIRDDQPVVAEQVVATGSGVRVRFARAGAGHLGKALDGILAEPRYRANAQAVAESLRAAGGARTAADALLRTAHTPASGTPA